MFIFLYIALATLVFTLSLSIYERKKLQTNRKYLIAERIIHWGSFFLILGLIGTAIMNTQYYSKEAIMESFQFSMPLVNLQDVDLASQLFIARYERRIVWDHHFIMGVFALALIIPWLYLFLTKPKKPSKAMQITFWTYFSLFMTFAFTGIVLHIGNWVEVDYDFRENMRIVHHYAYYVFYAWIFAHILHVVYRTIKSKADIIGFMIHGGKNK